MDNTKQCAWCRFIAKKVDVIFGSVFVFIIFVIVGLFIALVDGELYQSILETVTNKKFGTIDRYVTSFLACILVIPISQYFFGNTLGKKIWGISVNDINGNSLGFKKSFYRECMMFFRGLLFCPISCFYQYRKLTKEKIVSWDKELNLTVSCKKLSFLSFIIRLITSLSVILTIIWLSLTLS